MTEEDIRSSISQSGCDASGASAGAEVSGPKSAVPALGKQPLPTALARLERDLANGWISNSATADAALVLLAAVRAPFPPAPSTAWRDIASAPRDGTLRLFWSPLGGCFIAPDVLAEEPPRHEVVKLIRSGAEWLNVGYNPTHWQPLPPPPVGES